MTDIHLTASITLLRNTIDQLREAVDTLTHTLPATNLPPAGACPAAYTTIINNVTIGTPCIYNYDHTGAHRDDDGRTWTDQPVLLTAPATPCGEVRDEEANLAWPCVRPSGHGRLPGVPNQDHDGHYDVDGDSW